MQSALRGPESHPEAELRADIGSFASDPLGFVEYAYPWEHGELADSQGPRQWQRDQLGIIKQHLAGPDRHQPCRLAVASGHGIGKSALIAMIVHWSISTFEDCRCVVTANTATQLDTKTWPEISKWFRRAINSHWWDVQATSVSVRDPRHKETWRADAITWSENNTEAFAGLHNKGKRIVVIYDEASAIADRVWEVTEGALTDEDTEILWIAFGNPTQNTGRFFECFGRYRHRWHTRQIDSRTVEGTNRQQLDQWVQDYGEDSDFCRVRVCGKFPRAGSTQFIPGDLVFEAQRRKVGDQSRAYKVMSVDVARFGDDQTVIGLRQGLRFRFLGKLRGLDTTQVALRTMDLMRTEEPRLLIIDGDGIGGGVVDYIRFHMADWMKQREYFRLVEFHGGASPSDGFMYFNRRAEVWGLMRDWLHTGEIPNDAEMEADLIGPQYRFSAKNTIQLEKKEDMKKRGLSSPDSGDCLAMTFDVQPMRETHAEAVARQIEAAKEDPMRQHFIRLAETERRRKAIEAPKNYWE